MEHSLHDIQLKQVTNCIWWMYIMAFILHRGIWKHNKNSSVTSNCSELCTIHSGDLACGETSVAIAIIWVIHLQTICPLFDDTYVILSEHIKNNAVKKSNDHLSEGSCTRHNNKMKLNLCCFFFSFIFNYYQSVYTSFRLLIRHQW